MDIASFLKGAVTPEQITALQAQFDHAAYEAGIETISAAGALSVTKRFSKLNVTGTTAYTLADGTFVGQRKSIICVAGASTPAGTITPAHPTGFATVSAIGAIGDACEFIWDGAAWFLGANAGVTVA